jgi:hypothetical protein
MNIEYILMMSFYTLRIIVAFKSENSIKMGLSRKTRFILYALCHIFINTYEIKPNFCEKDIFYRITSLGV